jgi:uncharacterized membrane protein YeaQ/YmgE (transglycosylase-associated protein family)
VDCCHHGPHGPHGRGAAINFYIWCAVGAIVGAIAGLFIGSKTKVTRIEEVLVGVFGAFIGGEFVTAMLNSGKEQPNFTMGGLVNAIGGAIALILLLTVMRRAVGPMRSRKKPARGSR